MFAVPLQHCEDGSVSTSVYCKPIHMDRYLDLISHHPPLCKVSVVKTLFSRANVLSSSNT